MESVIVHGSRLQQLMSETGSSVSMLSAQELEALGVDFTVDALAIAPGVTVNSSGGFGGQASVRIRGNGSEQTLVLLDGVPINDPSSPGGGFDFARFDPQSVERIEILKGPQSTLWGTDAIGGVVSITTKRPDPGLGGDVFAEYGAFDTFRGGASVNGGNDAGDFRLAAVRTESDGFSKADEDNGNREEDGYAATTLSGRGGLALGGSGARLDTSLLWTESSFDSDSFAPGAQGSIGDGDETSDTEELAANLRLTAPLLDGRLENLLLLGYSDIERQNFIDGAPGFAAEGQRLIMRYQGTLSLNERNRLAFGAERDATEANGEDTTITGWFALYEFQPVHALTLTGGLRRDDHQQFGGETTARLAAAYQPSASWTLRASWGEGFKAPTIFQSTYICGFCGLREPNGNLVPETSEAVDVGVDWRSTDQRYAAGLTLFEQQSRNLIDFSFTAGYDNIAQVDSRGAEVFASAQLSEALHLQLNYTQIDVQDGLGMQRPRVPEHSADMTLAWKPASPFSATLLLRYNGEEVNTDGTRLGDWTRLDFSARWALSDALELFGRVENLLDADYQQVLGFGTPDRSAYVGARLRY
jgi:vitamin B12 transporter